MMGSLTAIVLMAISGREASRELNVFQIMEMRSIIGLAMLYPLIRSSGGLRAMKTERIWRHLGRNGAHYAGQFAWLQALSMIPLAQVIAIEFTTPAWTALMAVAFLGERLNIWRVLTIALGIIGVVIIVRPGVGTVEVRSADRARRGLHLRHFLHHGQVADPHRQCGEDHLLDADHPVGHRPLACAARVAVAIACMCCLGSSSSPFTGTFSHFCMAKALLYADATVVIPDGLPACAADGRARLADLCRAHRHVHGGRRGADPFRQPAQPEEPDRRGKSQPFPRHQPHS